MALATSADDFLGSLQGEARIDSTGAFTIDLEQARAKLQRFQLPSADHYILPLVACAVVGGADSLSVFSDQHRRLVDLSGLAVELESGGPASGYLHLGLATAGRLAGTDVYGEVWDGQAGCRFRVSQGQIHKVSLSQPPWHGGAPKTRLVLSAAHPWENRLAGAFRWLAGVGPARDLAGDLLKAYASYSPLPIRLNARQINLERQGHWRWLGTLNRPPLQLRPITALRHATLEREVPFSGYVGLGVGGGGVLVVVDGLLYSLEVPELPSEFRAILWHCGLQRDLSLLQLVENDELDRFRRQLSEVNALEME